MSRYLQQWMKRLSGIAAYMFYRDTGQGHWIYEKLQRPSSYFHMMVNLLYFFARVPRLHRVLSVGVEPVFGCNLSCAYCWRNLDYPGIGAVLERPRFMPFDLFKKSVDTLPASVEVMAFSGLGEPLLHPNIFDMIAYGADAGLRMSLYTNGVLLRGEVLDRLAASPVAVVNVSLEPDAATSKQYRGVDMAALSRNIREFHKKKRLGIELKFSLVTHAGNCEKMDQAYAEWGGFSDGFKVARQVSYDRHVGCETCLEPWLGNPMVLSNGDVSACCHTFGCPIVIGNLVHSAWGKIVNNRRHKEILTAFITKRHMPTICEYCDQFGPESPSFRFLKKSGEKRV